MEGGAGVAEGAGPAGARAVGAGAGTFISVDGLNLVIHLIKLSDHKLIG